MENNNTIFNIDIKKAIGALVTAAILMAIFGFWGAAMIILCGMVFHSADDENNADDLFDNFEEGKPKRKNSDSNYFENEDYQYQEEYHV